MPVDRVLWTGPYGSGLRDRAMAGASLEPSGLWLVASPMARDQVRRELAIRSRSGRSPRVWCWPDLWARVRAEVAEGPTILSDPASEAIFFEVMRQARRAGELPTIGASLTWPGYRRRLRRRLAAWTADERTARSRPPEAPAAAEEWGLFLRYRALLKKLGAEDEAGLAVWASRRLAAQNPPASLSSIAQATFLDWEAPTPARWRVLDHVIRKSGSVRVTLAHESGDRETEVYEAHASARIALLKRGFAEVAVEPELWRPSGLRELERRLFRRDGGPVATSQGIAIRGAPQGEGCARLVAREVRDRLDRGVPADEILVLFRRWSDPAEVTVEMMRDWGIAIQVDAARPLARDPAVAALLLAIGLPTDDWSTDRLIRLLRNGHLKPGWPGSDPLSMAASASIVKTSSIFRGREPLLNWLDRRASDGKGATLKAARARLARELIDRLFELLGRLDEPRPFADQMDRMFEAAESLGIGRGEDLPALDRFRESLEDRADALNQLGRGETPRKWSDFVKDVEALASDVTIPPCPASSPSVRISTLDDAEGARAGHIILADLAEGTFPAPDAVERFLAIRPGNRPDDETRRIYSREMLRFLRAIGSADSSMVFIYPTTDAKGQDLLRAGFLDELIGMLSPDVSSCHQSITRLDPALIDAPDLAGSPPDRRVRAVALARTRGESQSLAEILRHPAHRSALDGVATALSVLSRRLRGTPFGEYDGLLMDGDVVLDLSGLFPPEHLFTASQLETYIGCPFQYFCKYVLKLEPAERRDEIDEDHTERGSKIHDMLELVEQMRRDNPGVDDLDGLDRAALDRVTRVERVDVSEVELGLAEIERRRLIQTLQLYRVQHRQYEGGSLARPVPHAFEVTFGDDENFPFLEIGQGRRAVRLSGKIDRIDLVDGPDGPGFRVIDYKSGHGPSKEEVRQARMLQLPLYAMAVERSGLAGDGRTLRDVGYWALREDGYKPIAFEDWQRVQEAIEDYVGELVDRLRSGVFVVDSQVRGCEGFCDFRAICRVRQTRLAAKQHDRPVAPELPILSSRAKGKGGQG